MGSALRKHLERALGEHYKAQPVPYDLSVVVEFVKRRLLRHDMTIGMQDLGPDFSVDLLTLLDSALAGTGKIVKVFGEEAWPILAEFKNMTERRQPE